MNNVMGMVVPTGADDYDVDGMYKNTRRHHHHHAHHHAHHHPVTLGIKSHNPSNKINGGDDVLLSARHIIVTVPIGVLKHSLSGISTVPTTTTTHSDDNADDDVIHFSPPLPQYVQTVVESLGVTIPMKIAMCWKSDKSTSSSSSFDIDAWLGGVYNISRTDTSKNRASHHQLPPSWFLAGGRGAATPTTRPNSSNNNNNTKNEAAVVADAILNDLYDWERRTFGGGTTTQQQHEHRRLGLGRGPHLEVLHWDVLTRGSLPSSPPSLNQNHLHQNGSTHKDRCLVLGVEGALAKEFTRLQHQADAMGTSGRGSASSNEGGSAKYQSPSSSTIPLSPPLQAIVTYLLTELGSNSTISTTIQQPSRVQFSSWGSPFSRGGYAHLRAGYGDEEDINNSGGVNGARLQPWHSTQQHQLSQYSIDGRVYLAGEHTSADSFGSVQGAAETGMAAAMRVILASRVEAVFNEVITWYIVAIVISTSSFSLFFFIRYATTMVLLRY